MAGEERGQVRSNTDRANSRATSAVWTALRLRRGIRNRFGNSHSKGLVQVQMAHIAPALGGIRQPDLGIQVCTCASAVNARPKADGPRLTIKVHLPAVIMDNLAGFLHPRFEYTIRRRISNLTTLKTHCTQKRSTTYHKRS